MNESFDVRQLVRWLGSQGAKAGLSQSKTVTIESLRSIANGIGVKLPEKTTRQQLIDEIIRVASRRIDKSLDELFAMSHDDLVRYFEAREVESAELLDVLKELSIKPQRKDSRQTIIDFAARELSETGRFMRIASKHSSP